MKTLFLCICATWMISSMYAEQRSVIRESVQTLKTYPFSDPDPVAEPSHLYYPYFRFEGFAAKGIDKPWKTVEMENEYIKVTLYPEIGGKIWGAVDKTSGKEFIYNNHVVKFRDIAMRGPWTSGGIEFNFGIIGHAPTTSTPIDYLPLEKEDGSVSCYVSSYDWVTQTYWSVEVNLPSDKAYFTTTTTWYNPSTTDQPYYQWMNAGYKVAGNARFYYPGDHYIGHDGELSPFPIDEKGRDLSWYRNNNFGSSKSEHVLGFYNDFYGIYWHEEDFGSVHHAAYDEKLGMKIFLWGQARDGSIWEDLLTDTDGQYIELQSGRMYNQPSSGSTFSPFKHYGFYPDMTDQWTEYWFPIKGIGGISKASRIGALYVSREKDNLELAFSPVEELSLPIHIYDGEKEMKTIQMETKTLEPWKVTLPQLGSIPKGNLKIILGDHALVYSEIASEYQLNRPKVLPTDFDWNSVYGLYTLGEQWMNQKENAKATYFLLQALDKDPYFVPALNKLASLYERKGWTDEALSLLKTSLSLNAYDGEANYLYGLCHLQKGRMADAKDGFSVASRSSAYRSAAYTRLAEICLKEKDWNKAVHYALQSLNYNNKNLKARQVLMVAYRKVGKRKQASEQIDLILTDLPLYHFARFEKLYQDDPFPARDFQSLIRNELPFETYLELAEWYESVGCTDEALVLLECAGDYPIALYKRAYLLSLSGKEEESHQILIKGNTLSPQGVFPFRQENLKALEWADSVSGDWKTKYYRGLICWANQRTEEALDLFIQCDDPPYAPFYLSRANLKKQFASTNDSVSYWEDLQKAEQIEMSWRTGFALLNAYTEQKQWDNVVKTGKKYLQKYPENYYIGLKLANGYCETGEYTNCISLLKRMTVLPNEGAYVGRSLYRAAHLCQAMDYLQKGNYEKAQSALINSMDWPENLGVGKPYEEQMDSRLENYIQSLILSGRGDATGVVSALEKVTNYKKETAFPVSSDLLTALALRELGRIQEADQWISSWEQTYPDSPVVQWGVAIYQGDKKKAADLLNTQNRETNSAPWETSHQDVDLKLIINMVNKKLL